ncbi:MAG: hypothetical protein FWG94_05565 [Oscillospiraceae bacterium]|nr:hypothetical protein [Oscillospiraceae bacterium]
MKKVVSLLLVLLLSLGMVTTASAYYWQMPGTSARAFDGDADVLLQVSNVVYVPIDAVCAIDFDARALLGVKLGTAGKTTDYLIRDTDYPFRAPTYTFRAQQNSALVDSTKIEFAVIPDIDMLIPVLSVKIEFKEKFRNTNLDGVDFKYTITFGSNSTRTLSLEGGFSVGNDVIIADDADLNVINTEKGYIIKAEKYNSKLEVEVGENVVLNTRLFNGRRYWAWADSDWWEFDDEMKKKYNTIQEVVNLDWLGYNEATTTVHLTDFAADNYWVYSADEDGNLTYLGRSNNKDLPLVAKYYLSSREIDVDSDIEPEDDIDDEYDDVPEINPITGGDDVYPSNVNDNPGTGK